MVNGDISMSKFFKRYWVHFLAFACTFYSSWYTYFFGEMNDFVFAAFWLNGLIIYQWWHLKYIYSDMEWLRITRDRMIELENAILEYKKRSSGGQLN
jgi:hypothetical protein